VILAVPVPMWRGLPSGSVAKSRGRYRSTTSAHCRKLAVAPASLCIHYAGQQVIRHTKPQHFLLQCAMKGIRLIVQAGQLWDLVVLTILTSIFNMNHSSLNSLHSFLL